MVDNLNTSYENEIHSVDSEDFKSINFFAREALISGDGRAESLEKMAKNREI